MNNYEHKRQIALRINPKLIERLDEARVFSNFDTRTELIETACTLYVTYLEERLMDGYSDEVELEEI
jgi:metal-responsive CopG/Arc/MetJ family transcriptional regulator